MTAKEITDLFILVYKDKGPWSVLYLNNQIAVIKINNDRFYSLADTFLSIDTKSGHITKNIYNFDPKSHKLAETLFR